jgi:hypothetical protein
MAYFGDSKSAVSANYGQQAISSSSVAKRRALQKYFAEQEALEDAKMTATSIPPSVRATPKRYEKEDIGPKSFKKLKSNLPFESDLRPRWMRDIQPGAMKTVFDSPDLNQFIMQGVETPFCDAATNGGERCNRAFIYRNKEPEQKGTRFAPPQQLNCTQYCGDRCLEWLTNALQSPPKRVFIWSGAKLLGAPNIPVWTLFLQESKRQYDYSVYKTKMDGKSFQWLRTMEPFATSLSHDEDIEMEMGTKMSVAELAPHICAKLSEEGTSLRLSMQGIELQNRSRPQSFPDKKSRLEAEVAFREKLRNTTITFDHPGRPNAAWIRPNATWKHENYPELTYFTSLRSWYSPSPSATAAASSAPAPGAASNAKGGGSAQAHALIKPPAQSPAVINRLF